MTTTQTISRERLEDLKRRISMWGHGAGYTPEEVYALIENALKAMESEPYWWAIENRHGDARFVEDEHTKNDIWDEVHELNEKDDAGEYFDSDAPYKVIPVYRGHVLAAPPAPVAVPEATIEMMQEKFSLRDNYESSIAADVWNACRAAMQAEPVTAATVPDGWKLVPIISFPSQWAAGQKAFNAAGINKVDAVYKAMVAAAPTATDGQPGTLQHSVPGGWVKCSERMPEPGKWLALYGAPVFTHGPKVGKPYYEFSVDQGYLDERDGKFYLLNWESPGQIGDSYNNDLAIATHWMYWELPAAPEQE